MKDFEHESETHMGDIALLLGWAAPPDDDGFWFREDHGPVHDSDLRPFLIAEIERLRAALKVICERLKETETAPPIIRQAAYVAIRMDLEEVVRIMERAETRP